MSQIHPTAIVEDGAILGEDIPYYSAGGKRKECRPAHRGNRL